MVRKFVPVRSTTPDEYATFTVYRDCIGSDIYLEPPRQRIGHRCIQDAIQVFFLYLVWVHEN